MAFVRRTRPARSNTEPGIRIDWDHPLAQGLLFYGPFFYRNAPVDLAAGIPLIRDNGGTPSNSGIAKTKWGLALESNSLNGFGVWHHRYASSLIRRLVGGSKWSMAIACELDSRNTAGTASILMTVPYAGSGSWASPYHLIDIECEKADDTSPMGMTSGTTIGGALRNGTTATDCVYVDGVAHVYAVSFNTSITSGAVLHYTDGKVIEATSTAASGNIDDPGASGGYRVWMFGKGTADGTALGEGIDGRIHASAIWNRLLTANEHALFAADPLCMAVVDEWIWIPDAASYFGVPEIKGTLNNQTSAFPIYVMTDPTQTHIASSGDRLTELAIYASHNSGDTTLDVGVWDITSATSRTDIAGCPLVAVASIDVTGALGWKTGAVDVALVAGHEYAVGFASTSGSVATYRNTTDNKIYARSSSTGLDDLATEADPFPTASSGLGKDRTYSVRGKVTRSAFGAPFPSVRSSDTGTSASGSENSHSIDLAPTVVAGDLLLVIWQSDGDPALTWDNSTAGTWVQISGPDDGGTATRQEIYAKISDGTEGGETLVVTTDAAEGATWIALAIKDWYGTLDSSGYAVGTAFTSTSSDSPDPPSLSVPWGAENTLWIAIEGNDNQNVTVSAYPANYSDNQISASGTGTSTTVSIATRNLRAATEDAGAYTLSAAEQSVAKMLAIRPAQWLDTSPNTAPPKIVQRAHLNDDASSTTLVATFPDPTTPGNTIAGIVGYSNGEANTLITSMSESYVLDGGATAHSYRVESFYCDDIVGGSETFTVTLSETKSYRLLAIVEIEGGTFDDGAFANDDTASGTDDASSGNVTTTADNDLLVGFYAQITNQNLPAAGTGFSIIDTIVNAGGNAQMAEARVVPFAGTAAATFTPAGSSYYTWIAGLAFKPRRAPKIAHVPTTLGSSAGEIFTSGDSSGEGDVPYPAVVAYGDIAYLWLFVGDVASSGNVLLTADGTWTDITGVVYDSGVGDEAGARLYWRRCNGTEGGTTTPVTFDDTASGVPLRMGQIVTVSDAPATGTPHEAVQTAHGNGASVEASAITTLGPDRLGLRFYAIAEDDQGADPTPPYRWTRGQQLITGSASDGAFGVDYRTMSAESTYPATSMLGSGFDGWATVSLAIKPKTEDAGDGFEDIVHLGNSLVGTVANGGTLTIPSRRYTAGSTIFVTVATYKSGGPSVTSISGAGATWARVGSAPTAQNNGTTETWIGTGNTGGETTLTVTLPSNSYAAGASSEFTGLDESAYDQTGSTSSNTSTTSTSVTAGGANSQDNMLALATFSFSVSDATANIQDPPTTGYSSIGVHQDANAVIGYGSAYKIISAGETSSAAWTHDTGGGRVAQIFTFKAASIGGGGGVSIPIPVGTLTITGLQPVAKSARLGILSISVTRLYEGLTGVVITGYGFGASQGTSKVMLDGVTQTVTSWSNTSITFNVVAPSGYASPRTLQVQRPY